MNRLPFGSFHAAHFSPQQVQQWQSYLQNIQSPLASQSYPQEQEQQYTNELNKEASLPTDQHDDHNDNEDDDNLGLSKEAMAIFEFSEAYSAQRKQSNTVDDDDVEKGQQEINSILNISTTLHYDGIEAPPTSIILLSSSPHLSGRQSSPNQTIEATIEANCISTKQHLLNSAYLESCSHHQNEEHVPLMMWPVLPFRL
ncbi:unnamed protein product [Absidia cylindrospora]